MFCRGSGNLGFDRCLLYFAHEKEEQIENGGTTAMPMPLGKKEVSIYLSMNFINLRLRNASDNNVINIFIIKNNVPSANLAIGTEDIPFLYPFLSVLIISNITD